MKRSVILVGMPGAGKSTLGVMLAKALAKEFVDTDLLIQTRAGQCLQTLLDEEGYLALRQLEEEVLIDCDFSNHVVATGGSAVYSAAGMVSLRGYGRVVFLDVPLDELRSRIHDYDRRGIARRPGQSFESLFDERKSLYLHFSDLVVKCAGKTQEQLLDELVELLSEDKHR